MRTVQRPLKLYVTQRLLIYLSNQDCPFVAIYKSRKEVSRFVWGGKWVVTERTECLICFVYPVHIPDGWSDLRDPVFNLNVVLTDTFVSKLSGDTTT